MVAHFLECHLHLPAPEEPLQNLAGMLVDLGAEQCARFEFSFRVPYQDPTDGHRRQACVIPDRGNRMSVLPYADPAHTSHSRIADATSCAGRPRPGAEKASE